MLFFRMHERDIAMEKKDEMFLQMTLEHASKLRDSSSTKGIAKVTGTTQCIWILRERKLLLQRVLFFNETTIVMLQLQFAAP